jgi:hypothetical protein
MGGKFVLSDDAHAVEQVGTCYGMLLPFFEKTGITKLQYYTTIENDDIDCELREISVNSLSNHPLLLSKS